jgi:tetratricopeptide (TPR) repeat protein
MSGGAAPTYRIFISSPGDVMEERARAQRTIARLNGEFQDELRMLTIAYEEKTYSADHDPQWEIEPAAECDLVIGILWARTGTPLDPTNYRRANGRPYESGTAYEIETSLEHRHQHGQPNVVLFRKVASFSHEIVRDPREFAEQLTALNGLVEDWTHTQGGYLSAGINHFETSDQFETKLEQHLRSWLSQRGHTAGRVWRLEDKGSPFPGLMPYEAQYDEVFFGREESIRLCRQALVEAAARGCAFLLIVGASGSGKSSLARAGLVRHVALPGSAPGVNAWRVAVIRPGAAPLVALAEAFAGAAPSGAQRFMSRADWWLRLLQDSPELAVTSLAEMFGPDERLLLVADQLEEVFDVPSGGFTAALAALSRSGAAWVVATLRADSYAALLADATLRQLKVAGATFDLVPPDFAAIVRGPAKAAGLTFERRGAEGGDLGDDLVRAAGGPDALPLLQMTLTQLYDARDPTNGLLTYDAFEKKIGGLEGAIGRHADVVLEGLPAAVRQELRPLLLALTRIAPGGGYVARPTLRTTFETTPTRRTLVEALLAGRLLVADRREELRVAHEALLRNWQAARDILEKYALVLRVRDRLEPLARDWIEANQLSDHLLRPGRLLSDAETVLDELRVLGGAQVLVQFAEASVEQRQRAVGAVRAQLASDEQKIAGHMKLVEFSEAEDELNRVLSYLAEETDPDMVARRTRLDEQRQRVHRLAAFSMAARSALTFAGEEDFARALHACASSLRALGVFDDPEWWQHLPTQDLEQPQIEQLQQTAYRALLLFSGLQLVPGIVALFPRPVPGPPRPKSGLDVHKLAGLAPQFVLAAVIGAGGVGSFKLPGRMDKPEALAEFRKCLDALAWVGQVEEERAGARGEQRRPSRTSQLVQQIAEVMEELASGPKGASIDYGQWLRTKMSDVRPEPVDAADYFFIGLFNYFISKRRDALIAKILSLLQPRFPDLDAQSPLDAADRLLRAAVALEPEHYWPHWVLGRTLDAKGNHSSAELAFNAAIALEPNYSRGYEQRALTLGSQWLETHEATLRRRAETDSAKAMEVARGDPSIFWPRGELFERLGETRRAVDAYSRWLELEHDLSALIARGAGVSRLYALASQLVHGSAAGGLQADAHALLALVYLTWKDNDAALAAAESALRIEPKHAHALTAKGVVLLQKQELSLALAALDVARDHDPLNYRAALTRAIARETLTVDEAALAAWHELPMMSAQAAHHGREQCPRWMLEQTEDATDRILAHLRGR